MVGFIINVVLRLLNDLFCEQEIKHLGEQDMTINNLFEVAFVLQKMVDQTAQNKVPATISYKISNMADAREAGCRALHRRGAFYDFPNPR